MLFLILFISVKNNPHTLNQKKEMLVIISSVFSHITNQTLNYNQRNMVNEAI